MREVRTPIDPSGCTSALGAHLLSDVANPERIGRGGDCNEATLLDALWGDVPRRVGAAFFVFIGMGMQRWDKCGAMFVMVGCDVLCYW